MASKQELDRGTNGFKSILDGVKISKNRFSKLRNGQFLRIKQQPSVSLITRKQQINQVKYPICTSPEIFDLFNLIFTQTGFLRSLTRKQINNSFADLFEYRLNVVDGSKNIRPEIINVLSRFLAK